MVTPAWNKPADRWVNCSKCRSLLRAERLEHHECEKPKKERDPWWTPQHWTGCICDPCRDRWRRIIEEAEDASD